VGRISKEVERNKENNPRGRPSKLSACEKQSIVHQISSGKLNNAVQANQFINSIIPNPVTPQTVRNTLKESGFYSATKKKVPMLKLTHCQRWLKFARFHQNWTVEDWKKVLRSDETKINCIGSDGKVYVWKQQGEPLSDQTTTPTVKHGGGNNLMVWACMGWNGVGLLIEKFRERWMQSNIVKFWMREWWKALKSWICLRMSGTFSRTMTPNTPPRGQHSGFLITISKCYSGLPNPLT